MSFFKPKLFGDKDVFKLISRLKSTCTITLEGPLQQNIPKTGWKSFNFYLTDEGEFYIVDLKVIHFFINLEKQI
jgi:hypothetical protein